MGYLDQYDQGGRGFDKIVKAVAFTLATAILGYCFYWLFFRNWREERRIDQFLVTVEQQHYEEAYSYWGCTVEEPCRYYPFDEFLEDWGPESPIGRIESFERGRSYTQKGGAIIELTVNGEKQPSLWVNKDSQVVSFFPY